ncbi:MAG: HEAT repeat domain-containing protein, partial [Candidatus Poribacteria bacterium]|nr:HEAT repeat domain-containing protein [Candidatus Poribacteria bacterium]
MLSFDQLIQNLTDTTQPVVVRSSAIERLAAQGAARSIEFLIEALSDSDSMIRREAAKALQGLGATEAIEPLLEALQAESKDLTAWAMLEAIGELGNPRVLPTLESLSNVDSMLTRIEVKKCMSKIRERYGNGNTPQQLNQEAAVPAQKRATQPPESTLSKETPHPDSDPVEVEESEEGNDSLLHYLLNRRNRRTSDAAKATDALDQEQTAVSVEDTFQEPSVEPDLISEIQAEEIVDEDDHTPSTETPEETVTEAELAENVMPDVEVREPDEDSEIHDSGFSAPEEDTEIPQKKHRDPDEAPEINDLVKSISQSPRLVGSSVALPVLAPNAAT